MASTSGSAARPAQEPWARANPCFSAKAVAAASVREPTAASSAPGTRGRSEANVLAMPPVPRIPQRTFFSVMIVTVAPGPGPGGAGSTGEPIDAAAGGHVAAGPGLRRPAGPGPPGGDRRAAAAGWV